MNRTSSFKPLAPPASVSVIICTRNRPKDMGQCLKSIIAQTLPPQELVVVDSSDAEDTRTLIDGLGLVPFAVAYYHSKPGLTLQRNLGVSKAAGDVLVFLDDDVILDKEYLAGMVEPFENDAEGTVAGVQGSFVGGKSLNPTTRLLYRLFMMSGETGAGRMQRSGFPSYVALPKRIIETDVICGGNTAYRKKVFEQFKFNERLAGYGYMEDDDFSYRVSRRYRLLQTPKARMVHNHSPAARDHIEARQRMEVFNHATFFRDHLPGSWLNRLAFAWSELGISLTVLRHFGFGVLKQRLRAYRELLRSTESRPTAAASNERQL